MSDREMEALDVIVASFHAMKARAEAAIDNSFTGSEYGERCVEVPTLRAALTDEETTDE